MAAEGFGQRLVLRGRTGSSRLWADGGAAGSGGLRL